MKNSAENEFLNILQALQNAGVLKRLILVGSWCLPVYRHLYASDEIPVLRTTDLDFLIEAPQKSSPPIDVPTILEGLGFSVIFDASSSLTKYERDDLEIEFLVARSRSTSAITSIPNLRLTAQMLSYMEIPKLFAKRVDYCCVSLKVPELEAYIIHKILVQPIRQDIRKKEKDARTVLSLIPFVLSTSPMKSRLTEVFRTFPDSWQRKIRKTATITFPQIAALLKEFVAK